MADPTLLSAFESVLLREIERSATMIIGDPGLRAPMPRFRIEECSVLFDRELLRKIAGKRRRHAEEMGTAIISVLGAFVESNGASNCVYVTTADVPDLPKAIVAMVVDRQTGESRCLGRQVFLHPKRLGPVAELSVDDLPEGPQVVGLLLRDRSLSDAHARKAWEAILEYGLIRVAPEEPWAIDDGRLLH
jgi:hypothetical protein